MKVYLLIREDGSYSDYTMEIVSVHLTNEGANAKLAKLNHHVKLFKEFREKKIELHQKIQNDNPTMHWIKVSDLCREKEKDLKAELGITADMDSYYDTEFSIAEFEVEA